MVKIYINGRLRKTLNSEKEIYMISLKPGHSIDIICEKLSIFIDEDIKEKGVYEFGIANGVPYFKAAHQE